MDARDRVILEVSEEILNLEEKEPLLNSGLIENASVLTDEFDKMRFEVVDTMQTILDVESDRKPKEDIKYKLLKHAARTQRLLMVIEKQENLKSKYL